MLAQPRKESQENPFILEVAQHPPSEQTPEAPSCLVQSPLRRSLLRRVTFESVTQLFRTLSAIFFLLEVQFSAYLRLTRYRLRTVFRKPEARQLWKPLKLAKCFWQGSLASALVLLSVSCSLVSPEQTGPLQKGPALSKGTSLKKRKMESPWRYILPVDHGVRADKSGKGHFRASRFHGEHNGIDLLAPIGTSILSACDGQIMSGASQSFGRWVHIVCPVPKGLTAKTGPQPWASLFFAHLKQTETPVFEWVSVRAGQKVGSVGKSGNAKGESVQPHVHVELIIQKNRRSALDERHLGSDQSDVNAASFFTQALQDKCLRPFGFRPKSRLLRRARRVDPFVALSCLSDTKPVYKKAPSPLESASNPWSQFYIASDFNVDRGFGSR